MVSKLEGIKKRLKFEGYFGVDPRGRNGGLAMLWGLEVEVNLINFYNYHINVEIYFEGSKMP